MTELGVVFDEGQRPHVGDRRVLGAGHAGRAGWFLDAEAAHGLWPLSWAPRLQEGRVCSCSSVRAFKMISKRFCPFKENYENTPCRLPREHMPSGRGMCFTTARVLGNQDASREHGGVSLLAYNLGGPVAHPPGCCRRIRNLDVDSRPQGFRAQPRGLQPCGFGGAPGVPARRVRASGALRGVAGGRASRGAVSWPDRQTGGGEWKWWPSVCSVAE